MKAKENGEVEVTIPGGWAARAKGYRLMDFICLLTAGAVVALAWYAKGYAGEYEKNAQLVRESGERVAETLKHTNKETIETLRQIKAELARGNDAQRETNCLLDPALRNRSDAREICKRLGRDRDR